MNRAIHAETLKTRLDNDGHLTGYIDEMINDCPSVRPDLNSLVDEVYTQSLIGGEWEDVETRIEGKPDALGVYMKYDYCAGRIMRDARALTKAANKVYNALSTDSPTCRKNAVDKYCMAWGNLAMTMLTCAGYLQIDAEKLLRKQAPGKKKANAATCD